MYALVSVSVSDCVCYSSKQKDVEEFAEYTAEKIVKFKGEFLYTSLLRKLLQETTKEVLISFSAILGGFAAESEGTVVGKGLLPDYSQTTPPGPFIGWNPMECLSLRIPLVSNGSRFQVKVVLTE